MYIDHVKRCTWHVQVLVPFVPQNGTLEQYVISPRGDIEPRASTCTVDHLKIVYAGRTFPDNELRKSKFCHKTKIHID